jgi:hypothetical protein
MPQVPDSRRAWIESGALGGALHARHVKTALMTGMPELIPALARIGEDELHALIGCFGQHVQHAIDVRDRDRLERGFELATELLDAATPEVENAFVVSFLESLALPENEADRRWALSVMPAVLEQAWRTARDFRERLFDD